jgi:hypothetical protein
MTHKSFSATAVRSGSATRKPTIPAGHSGACRKHARIPSVIVAVLYVGLAVTSLEAVLMCQDSPALTASNTMQGQVGGQVSIPRLLIYRGSTRDLVGHSKQGVNGMTFSLYDGASGGAPQWMETQNVTVDSQGNYSIVLGITKPDGVPADIFSSGLTRWLGIRLEHNVESPRVVLASVPFAFHASAADSLASHTASEYVLAQQLQTSSGLDQLGLTSLISASIASQLDKNGNQYARLDVQNRFSSDQLIRGMVALDATGTATAASGFTSFPVDLFASSFNSATAQPETKVFRWQVAPVRSNTTSPSASLNLLYGGTAAATPALTGLSINDDGTINFAPRQKLFQFENAGNFMFIQDAITAAGQSGAVLVPPTYTGTDSFVNPSNIPVIDLRSTPNTIDVRDLPGMICDGSADSSGPLNRLFQRSDYSLWKGSVTFRRCPYVRLDNQLVIRGQEAVDIDLTGTTLFGCNGAPGPLVLLQRSGNINIEGGVSGTIYAAGTPQAWTSGTLTNCGVGNASKFTGSIGTDNSIPQGGATGVTTTANVFRRLNLYPDRGIGITNYCALCTTGAENQEAYIIEENRISCYGSAGSIGVGLISGNAQSRSIANNNIGDCQFGIALWSPYNDVKGNQFGGNGNYDAYPPVTGLKGWWGSRGYWATNGYGAAIGCWSKGNIIEFNNTFEESGMFIFGRDDNVGGGCSAVLRGNTAGPDYVGHSSSFGQNLHGGLHVPPNAYTIDSAGAITLDGGNNIQNCAYNGGSTKCISNGRPVIGTSTAGYDGVGGSQSSYYVGLGNILGPVAFDPRPPQGGFQSLSGNISTSDEILETKFSAYGGYNNPPLKYWWAGNPFGTVDGISDVWAAGIIDQYGVTAPRTSFQIDQIRNDYSGGKGSYVFPQTFVGGVATNAASSITNIHAGRVGGSSAGSTWGYTLCGQSGGQTWLCMPEVQVSGSATLGSQNNIIWFDRPGDYGLVQLWLTTNPGDGRRTGMIAQYTTLNANAGCDTYIVQGCQSGRHVYMNDRGQGVITAGTPPAPTADGSINIPSGACLKKNGACLAASDVGALASSTQLAQS